MMTCAIYLIILFPKIATRPRRKATHREVQVPTILTVSYPSVGLSVLRYRSRRRASRRRGRGAFSRCSRSVGVHTLRSR